MSPTFKIVQGSNFKNVRYTSACEKLKFKSSQLYYRRWDLSGSKIKKQNCFFHDYIVSWKNHSAKKVNFFCFFIKSFVRFVDNYIDVEEIGYFVGVHYCL